MDNSFLQWSLPTRGSRSFRAHWVRRYRLGHLQIVETLGKEREKITESIVQLALRGPYNLIAGDEWLPDRDTLYRSIRRHTLKIEETLNNPSIRRPMTCLQLLDLLIEEDMKNRPTLIWNFLHHFYNADVDLSLRDRTLDNCCKYTKRISLCKPVVVLVPRVFTEEYNRFFPILAAVADEIIPPAECIAIEAAQSTLF
jgi:hypothetical protein